VLKKILEVLLIEDSLEDANLVIQTLKDFQPGIAISTVRDGAEALDCLFGTGVYKSPYTPQLILLDLNLPKVSGLEVLRVIRSYARTSVIPVVIFSDSPAEQKVAEGYKLGANSYILKPHDLEQFRQMVRQIAAYWTKVLMPQGMHELTGPAGTDEASSKEDPASSGL
jgi:two-component system, response regulator